MGVEFEVRIKEAISLHKKCLELNLPLYCLPLVATAFAGMHTAATEIAASEPLRGEDALIIAAEYLNQLGLQMGEGADFRQPTSTNDVKWS